MANTVSYIIQLKDQFGATAARVRRSMQKIDDQTKKTSTKVNKLQAGFRKLGRGIQNISAESAAAMGAFSIAFAIAAKKAIDKSVEIEDAMQDIARVSDLSGARLMGFENVIESMSEQLGKSKLGLAQMAFQGSKLGIASKDMKEFLMTVSKTAISFDMLDEEAARAIGSIQAKMGLAKKETIALLDSVNYLADTTTASGARMVNVLERTSGTMKLLKVPPKVTAGFVAFADQIESTSELAASGLNMFFTRLERMPGMTTKLMADPMKTVRAELERIAKLSVEARGEFIRKNFGDEAGRFVKKMVGSIELFDKTMTNAMSNKAVGSMTRELENQMKRSSKAFQTFNTTISNTVENLGDALKPALTKIAVELTPIVNSIGKFIQQNPKVVEFAATFIAVAAAVAGATAAFKAIAFVLGIIGFKLIAIGAAVTAVVAGITFLANNWDMVVTEIKSALIELANMFIRFNNKILSMQSKVVEFFGFDPIKLDKEIRNVYEKPTGGFAPRPDMKAPSAPAQKIQGEVSGEIVVKAEQGTEVKKTSMKRYGPMGMDLGLNMAGGN